MADSAESAVASSAAPVAEAQPVAGNPSTVEVQRSDEVQPTNEQKLDKKAEEVATIAETDKALASANEFMDIHLGEEVLLADDERRLSNLNSEAAQIAQTLDKKSEAGSAIIDNASGEIIGKTNDKQPQENASTATTDRLEGTQARDEATSSRQSRPPIKTIRPEAHQNSHKPDIHIYRDELYSKEWFRDDRAHIVSEAILTRQETILQAEEYGERLAKLLHTPEGKRQIQTLEDTIKPGLALEISKGRTQNVEQLTPDEGLTLQQKFEETMQEGKMSEDTEERMRAQFEKEKQNAQPGDEKFGSDWDTYLEKTRQDLSDYAEAKKFEQMGIVPKIQLEGKPSEKYNEAAKQAFRTGWDKIVQEEFVKQQG